MKPDVVDQIHVEVTEETVPSTTNVIPHINPVGAVQKTCEETFMQSVNDK